MGEEAIFATHLGRAMGSVKNRLGTSHWKRQIRARSRARDTEGAVVSRGEKRHLGEPARPANVAPVLSRRLPACWNCGPDQAASLSESGWFVGGGGASRALSNSNR